MYVPSFEQLTDIPSSIFFQIQKKNTSELVNVRSRLLPEKMFDYYWFIRLIKNNYDLAILQIAKQHQTFGLHL